MGKKADLILDELRDFLDEQRETLVGDSAKDLHHRISAKLRTIARDHADTMLPARTLPSHAQRREAMDSLTLIPEQPEYDITADPKVGRCLMGCGGYFMKSMLVDHRAFHMRVDHEPGRETPVKERIQALEDKCEALTKHVVSVASMLEGTRDRIDGIAKFNRDLDDRIVNLNKAVFDDGKRISELAEDVKSLDDDIADKFSKLKTRVFELEGK